MKTVLNSADIASRKAALARRGYGIYTVPDGVAIADPLDDADGFYIESPTEEDAVNEAYTHLFEVDE